MSFWVTLSKTSVNISDTYVGSCALKLLVRGVCRVMDGLEDFLQATLVRRPRSHISRGSNTSLGGKRGKWSCTKWRQVKNRQIYSANQNFDFRRDARIRPPGVAKLLDDEGVGRTWRKA